MLRTMKLAQWSCLFGMALLLAIASEAQANWWRLCRPRVICPDELTRPPEILPKDPSKQDKKDPIIDPVLAPVTTAALGDTTTAVPHIMGDFFGPCYQRVILVPTTQTVTTVIPSPSPGFPPISSVTTTSTIYQQVVVCDPVASRGGSGFKVADNESPRPTDRAFFTYNYFNSIQGNGGFTPGSQISEAGGTRNNPTEITTTVPGVLVAGRVFNLHRELFGFEKTFLGGDASVELRLPIFQTTGDNEGLAGQAFGDLTVVMKYALINNRDTGNVFSVGLAVTAPTGPAINTIDGNINSTLLQPFFGYIWLSGNLYFQGIHSVVIPTDSRDITLLFNDLGTGYVLRTPGSRFLAFVAPNFEVHVSTPLNHRNPDGFVFASDLVTLTGGVHLGLGDGRPLLSFGLATPVTGPRPFDVEAFFQFGFRF